MYWKGLRWYGFYVQKSLNCLQKKRTTIHMLYGITGVEKFPFGGRERKRENFMPLVVVALAELALGETQRPGPAPGQVIVRCCWFERPIPGRRLRGGCFLLRSSLCRKDPGVYSGCCGCSGCCIRCRRFVPSDRSSCIALHSRAFVAGFCLRN